MPLPWEGSKPRTGIQEKAREARLALLEQACARLGILHLLLAHHADDQEETVAMRREKGSGIAGLAGMAAIRETAQVRILRPLLGVGKADLRAFLRAMREDWIEDPANADPRFWRGRHRLGAQTGSDASEEASRDHDAARLRTTGEWRRALFLARHATLHPFGHLHLDAKAFDALEPSRRADLIRAVVRSVSGAAFPPQRESCEAAIERLAASPTCSHSLGGALIRRAAGRLSIMRDPGRIDATLKLAAGTTGSWDGRYLVHAPVGQPLIVERATGEEIDTARAAGAKLGRPPLVPRAALLGLPALRNDRGSLLALGPLYLGTTGPHGHVMALPRPIHALAGATFGKPPVASTNN